MKGISKHGVIVVFILFMASNLQADSAYIKSYRTNLLETAGGKKTPIVLKRGTRVDTVKKQGLWVFIRTEKNSGWVHKLVLSNKKPLRRISLLRKKVNISHKARKRASTFTSAAAARGFLDSGHNVLKDLGEPDFVALAEVETVTVDPDEATRFLSKEDE